MASTLVTLKEDATMKELKVGVVGLGWVAGAHIETFKHVKGARVVAVCDTRKLDPAEVQQRCGLNLKIYRRYRDMLADPEIDIIDICTPHPFHPPQAMAAARAGKHILLEKPIAIRFEDAKAMRRAIRRAGVNVCVGFECRYSQHFTMVKAMVDKGLLGDLHYGEVDYYHGIGPWYGQFAWNVKKAMGGSSLLTAGCHALDALLWVMNEPVVEVTSYETRSKSAIFAPYEYPTTSVTILKFKTGKVGKVASSIDCLQPYYFHCHLVGSKGSLLDNRFYAQDLKTVKAKWSVLGNEPIDSGDVKDPPYEPQFQAFVDSIHAKRVMPLTDFETAYESHRVCFAAARSAQERRPVRLSEIK
jgi:predicted dehydrogenase